MNLNIFSDLRKPGLVPGESLSLSTKFDSVLEKNQTYITENVNSLTKIKLQKGLGVMRKRKTGGNTTYKKVQNPSRTRKILPFKASALLPMES